MMKVTLEVGYNGNSSSSFSSVDNVLKENEGEGKYVHTIAGYFPQRRSSQSRLELLIYIEY